MTPVEPVVTVPPDAPPSGRHERGAFARLGRGVARRPWWVVAVWAVLAVVVVAFAPAAKTTTDQADFLPHSYDSVQAGELMSSAFPQEQTSGATIVFDRADGRPLTDDDVATIGRIASGLDLGTVFTEAGKPQVSPTKEAAIVDLGLADGADAYGADATDQLKDVRSQLSSAVDGTGLEEGVTGTVAQNVDDAASGQSAEAIVMLATLVLIIVLLGFIFRSVLVALMPIVVVGVVALVANGLIAFASEWFGLSNDSSTGVILIVVLFGIGTDYILFFLFRYRERRRLGEDHRTAVAHALSRAGEPIASAGAVVLVAFLTLVLSSLGIFRAIGPSLAIAVGVTLLAALTLVPAVVTLLGRALFWPSKTITREPKPTRFAAIGRAVGRHPGRWAVASGGVLVILSVFALGFSPTFDLSSSGSSSTTESAQATARMEAKGFSAGATDPTPVVLHAADGKALTEDEVAKFADALAKTDGVGQVSGQLLSQADPSTAVVMVALTAGPTTDAAQAIVKDDLRPAADAAAPDGATAYVGGTAAVFVDFKSAMNRDYAVVFPVAAAIILIILMLVLRSLVAPWYLMLSVGLGFTATLGATVVVFQHLKGDSGLIFLLPIYIYLFVVALGTDYNILMVTRLREEARAGKTPREAAAEAIKHAGPTIGAAGMILAGTFASLMLAGNSLMTSMGFAIAFGIVIAAFVMSLVFTPALTALVGHKAWWPGHGDEPTRAGEAPEAQKEAVLADA
ncbi:MMPL family transporter [Luteimicrobium sp. NPDC057192]|uniref:MMPL family transporter n=1 Tax=Luteimicrobium sp. NPDC057192 TaxID=3346042 RepID=UPI00363787D6